MARAQNPFQVTQLCFDRANRLCREIKEKGGAYDKEQIKALVKMYADCIFCMSQGYVAADADQWEILNRRVGELAPPGSTALEFRTLIKQAAHQIHQTQIIPQLKQAIDDVQDWVVQQSVPCPECCGPDAKPDYPLEGQALKQCGTCWEPRLKQNMRIVAVQVKNAAT